MLKMMAFVLLVIAPFAGVETRTDNDARGGVIRSNDVPDSVGNTWPCAENPDIC